MYEEKKNPFKRVGFHQESESAHTKTLRPMTAPILSPGQRYGGSYSSAPSAQYADMGKPMLPPLLKRTEAPVEAPAAPRLGERKPEEAASKAAGGMWHAPSFAEDVSAAAPSYMPPDFSAKEPEDEDFFLPPMNAPRAQEMPAAYTPNELNGNAAAPSYLRPAFSAKEPEDFFLPPMDAPRAQEMPAAYVPNELDGKAEEDEDDFILPPLTAPLSKPIFEDSASRALRGFGKPAFSDDASSARQEKTAEEVPEEKQHRRSRRERRRKEEQEASKSEEPLFSASPRPQPSEKNTAEIGANEDWQKDPLYAQPSPYLNYSQFDMDSVPMGVSYQPVQDNVWGNDFFAAGAAYAAGQSEALFNDFQFSPENQIFVPGVMPPGMTDGGYTADSFPAVGNGGYASPELENLYTKPEFQPDGLYPNPADSSPLNAIPEQMSMMDSSLFAGEYPPPSETYASEDIAAQDALGSQYAQAGHQVYDAMEQTVEQPRPVPAYTPSDQSSKAQKTAEKKPWKQTIKDILPTAGYIIIALIFLFMLIYVGRAMNYLKDNQEFVKQYDQDTPWDAERSAAIRVDLPPAGQSIPPMITPEPPSLPASAAASPKESGDAGQEAVAEQTAPPVRTRLLRYPNNSLTDILLSMVDIHNEYPDVKGRLVIPGVLDEYVVQTTTGSYLARNYRGTASAGGAVYMGEGTNLKQPPENILLRASDAAEGKGFQVLWQFSTGGADFCSQHHFATLTTLYEEENYVLFAVVSADTNTDSPGHFSFSDKLRFTSDEEMMAFVNDARARSLYSFPVDVNAADRLLTLATVSNSPSGQCLVLLYRMLRSGETF